MVPRPATPPTPPERVIRTMQAPISSARMSGNPFLTRHIRSTVRAGLWQAIGFHYLLVILLIASVWPIAMRGAAAHPEIVIKLAGVYCFLIGALIIPLIAPIFLQPFGETDQAADILPIDRTMSFDARLYTIIFLSALALIPLLPLFLFLGPARETQPIIFQILPFIQGVLTTGWVHLLMEMTGQAKDAPTAMVRRLALITIFVFIHLIMVGLLAQLSFETIQAVNALKLIIDLNPFSQLYILMEGPEQNRMIINSDFQHFLDFRLYLLIISGFIGLMVWGVYRANLRGRSVVM
jgi:hypothetical protein